MAVVNGYKEIKSAWSNGKTIVEITYDKAVDTGVMATYDLMKLDFAAIITGFYAKVVTAVTSLGAPVIDVGIKSGVTDALMKGMVKADFPIGGVVYDKADQILPLKIEANAVLAMTVGTADLTAGKVVFVFELEKYFAS